MFERKREFDEERYPRAKSDLIPLRHLSGWGIADNEPDIRGWNIVDNNDKSIGHIDDLLIDKNRDEAVMAIIGYGTGVLGSASRRTLIPLDNVRLDERKHVVRFDDDEERIKKAPEYDERDRDFGHFFDYWGGGGRRPEEEEEIRPADAYTEEDLERKRSQARGEREEARPSEERMEPGYERERADEESRQMQQREEPGRKVRILRHRLEKEREVRPGEQVVEKGETVVIPIVEEKRVVTGEVVVQPEDMEEDEDEEEIRRASG